MNPEIIGKLIARIIGIGLTLFCMHHIWNNWELNNAIAITASVIIIELINIREKIK